MSPLSRVRKPIRDRVCSRGGFFDWLKKIGSLVVALAGMVLSSPAVPASSQTGDRNYAHRTVLRPVPAPGPIASPPPAGQAPQQSRPVSVEMGAGTGYNGWFTADDDDSEAGVGHAIDYHVAGIPFWEVSAAASVAGASFVGAKFRNALDGSIGAQRITGSAADADKTLTGFDVFVDLMFLRENRRGFGYTLLSGLRLGFRSSKFHGPATAVEPTAFLDAGGALTSLNAGDVFAFDARFDDWHLGLLRAGQVRWGVYWSVLEKPHEAFEHPFGGPGQDNLVVDTRISGRGVFVSRLGTNIQLLGRFGVVDFEPQSGMDIAGLFEGTRGFAALGSLTWQPRIGLDSDRILLVVPMLGLLFRADFLDSPTQPFDANDSELSMDIHAEIGLGFSWSFGVD